MTKKAITAAAAAMFSVLCSLAMKAQERPDISVMGMYGWNETWRNHFGADITGFIPLSRNFEADAAMEVHSPKTFSATVTARPKFPLGTGEIFIDASANYRLHGSYEIADLNLAASAGYRMEYVSAQVGIISHFTMDLEQRQNVTEPLNLLYRIAFNIRPSDSRWNAGGGVANYTPFEYERTWEPMYFLHGLYKVNGNISALLRCDLKPAGAFHLNAQFWGIAFRAGVDYKF